MSKILIIEDDRTLNEGIAMTLEGPEMNIARAGSIKEAKRLMEQGLFDLILLDVNLPDGNGFEFCKELRQQTDVPIIFLTANDMELDIVRGLELGGDDYITKPFSLMVLRARVNSVLRRRQGSHETREKKSVFRSNGLVLDFEKMNFSRNGQPVILSRTEQKLLKLLVVNRGQVLSKEQLLDRVWETEYVDDHALTVTIKRLRDKLGTGQIKSIYGIGYRWEKEDDE
ncbi:response regulator transcription factor [Anaerovorax odorimutans]|uniref:Stage 0 sporulation protein A homolog n=1 Tax=Anaerovorax odorimutans TaxID=109327 RepID=A0ABT1RJ79_9FIRM|nr:response regulator transcription factor [Anaerovorax odorimutans]MCQ4635243.1 response regulator transcription factor [Anaerovorax odorimutans]